MKRDISTIFSDFDKRLIFNMDETMLALGSESRLRVVVPKDISFPKKRSLSTNDAHITLIMCVGADGTAMKPTVVLPLKTFPANCLDIVDAYCWSGHHAGWITEETFADWVEKIFIPHISSIRDKNDLWSHPGLLFLDAHASRSSNRALNALLDNNIAVVTIPSHTSHILQPLDVGVNGTFKKHLRKLFRATSKMTQADKRAHLLKTAVQALYIAQYPGTIMHAWQSSGLVPWNPSRVTNNPQLVTLTPIEAPTKSSRSRVCIAGKLLTSAEIIESLASRPEQARSAKRKRGSRSKEPVELKTKGNVPKRARK